MLAPLHRGLPAPDLALGDRLVIVESSTHSQISSWIRDSTARPNAYTTSDDRPEQHDEECRSHDAYHVRHLAPLLLAIRHRGEATRAKGGSPGPPLRRG